MASKPGGPSWPTKKSREESPPQIPRSAQPPLPPRLPPLECSSSEVTVAIPSPSPADDDIVVVEPSVKPNAVQALPIQSGTRGSRVPSREGADKGKDPAEESIPIYTADYGVDALFGEVTITIEMRFKATDQALHNHRLAEELARMVMLPANWEIRKAHPIGEIQPGAYTSLIGIIYDVTVLAEGVTGFARLNAQLEDPAQTARARVKVVNELLQVAKEQERKNKGRSLYWRLN
uniref:Uncharacterized protein LOC114914382 n=1 Tax=Elaeis guineensis var. tenera TaxID=51953 RepID=A0A8N4F965_ELAGV|nr:uncharacterized protein LOC114914382 [Elaeis guineensis]